MSNKIFAGRPMLGVNQKASRTGLDKISSATSGKIFQNMRRSDSLMTYEAMTKQSMKNVSEKDPSQDEDYNVIRYQLSSL
ncbi:hypothetical protein PsorP6_017194 [Peronosclerospora sorghi]|uniref:Uncharacterized protein n=1 Tax=Peronosclerospora sorghi TaxID=230839 RepID=A0ACC0WG10_9STRA|nr:hypothetical protein PsorP6_017194 [Peronosclerospora sorghi]